MGWGNVEIQWLLWRAIIYLLGLGATPDMSNENIGTGVCISQHIPQKTYGHAHNPAFKIMGGKAWEILHILIL